MRFSRRVHLLFNTFIQLRVIKPKIKTIHFGFLFFCILKWEKCGCVGWVGWSNCTHFLFRCRSSQNIIFFLLIHLSINHTVLCALKFDIFISNFISCIDREGSIYREFRRKSWLFWIPMSQHCYIPIKFLLVCSLSRLVLFLIICYIKV